MAAMEGKDAGCVWHGCPKMGDDIHGLNLPRPVYGHSAAGRNSYRFADFVESTRGLEIKILRREAL
jgi:hypothetical protein